VIPPVSLGFAAEIELFTAGASKPATVEVTAARTNTSGTVHLEAPAGWKVSPALQNFRLAAVGEKTRLTFTITAPAELGTASVRAVADINGAHFDNQRALIRYDHIPLQLLQPPARLRLVALDLKTHGEHVGYLPGAGDSTAEDLTQMGYTVTELTGADLTPEKLRSLDAVVIGVRAFNERTDLAANFPGLLAYVEAGGTVIAQYNRPNGLKTQQLGPYKLSIAGDAPRFRVTDEKSPVKFLAPDSHALNSPNHILPSDFEGWVQERGAYFPSSWDEEHYTSDPRDERSGRGPARRQHPDREVWQRPLRLHRPRVFPAAPRGRARSVPVVRELDFARKRMSAGSDDRNGGGVPPPRMSEAVAAAGEGARPPLSDTESETTGLPGLRSWRAVYTTVIAVFILWVGLLTWLTERYS